MTIKKLNDDDADLCQLAIDQDFTIYVIDEIKEFLDVQRSYHSQFDIDLSEVEEADTAAIQLLLAFQKMLISEEKNMRITASSEPVRALMDSYSLTQRLTTGGGE